MKKQLNSKTSLGCSILSLILCVSMFLGTTFAWFTDVAESRGNVISTGNLKIDLELLSVDDSGAKQWNSIKENSDPVFDYTLWEPGFADIKLFKVENEGSLALKWKAIILPYDEMGILADVIDVFVITSQSELDYPTDRALDGYRRVGSLREFVDSAEGLINGNLVSGASSYFGIALKMRTDAGNEYQDKALPQFDIRLVATQYTYEEDGFDDQYDVDATFPPISYVTKITVPVENNLTADNKLASGMTISDQGEVNADLPADVLLNDGATELTLNVKPAANNTANIQMSDGQASRTIDVSISGVSKNNTTPMVVNLGAVLPTGLKNSSVELYHIENGTPVKMGLVDSFTAHNQFTYDSATGNVTIYVASFSEFVLISNPSDPWDGTEDTVWMEKVKVEYDTESTFYIESPEQLAALGTLVAEGYDFAGKTVKITKSLDLGGHATEPKTFYPIGYRYSETNTNDDVGTFRGALDGDLGTTKPDGTPERARIFHLSQSTWAIKGHYDNGYYNRSLGLFAHLEDATIKNLVIEHFEIEGEFADTGCIAGGASGGTFDNISLYRNDIATYNTGVAGIVGWDWGDNEVFNFNNIHIDDTNNIRALWGSWDVACGGLMGFLESTSRANITNCTIAAKLDVFNDVCANYQYYQYRYAGMLIGTVGRASVPDSSKITCSNVKVYLGDWTDYYYCEFVKNSQASYTEDFQFSRVEEHDIVFDLLGNPVSCTHDHDDEREDRLAFHLPFSQLYTGYSWGAQAVYAHDGVEVLRYDYTITYFDGTHVVGAEYVLDNSADYPLHIYPVEGNIWIDVYGNEITSIPAGTESNVMLYLNTIKQNMIRFVDQDGFVISEQDIVLGKDAAYYQANVIEPAVPQIPGYVGLWPDYITMLVKATGDVVVHPVYSNDDEFKEEDILDKNFDLNQLFEFISNGEALTMYQDLTGNFTSASTKVFSTVVGGNKAADGDTDARLDLDSFKLELDCGANGNQDWIMFDILSGHTLTIGAGRSGSGTLTFDFLNLHKSSSPSIFKLEKGSTLVIERGVTIEVRFPVGDKNHNVTDYVGAIISGFSYETSENKPELADKLNADFVVQMINPETKKAYDGVYIVTDVDANTIKLVVTGDTVFVGN